MIVTQGSNAVSNIEDRHAFTIKANAKAFKLLSSNLYSNKPLAILREIGCNALDSHQAAGKADVPFKLVLPSDMHPWLEIIDYGTGLDDDQVKNIFTTYFESTKTTSNDYIGAMGLGSKSPFSYTDAFEVYARQNGVQNTYTCFLNKSGAPELFLLETNYDDPEKGIKFEDGVTIKVPIKANDYELFRKAALQAYRFFPVKPLVGVTGKNFQWDEVNYGFEGTNFKVLKGSKQCFALMGPVAYPLDLTQFTTDGFMKRHMDADLGGFVIDFGIGKLDVNAGREGLSYDEDTIENLIEGVKNIRAEMAAKLEAEIEACPTIYDAMRYNADKDPKGLFKLQYKAKGIGNVLYYRFVDDKNMAEWQCKEINSRYKERLKDVRAHEITISPASGGNFVLIDVKRKYQKKIRWTSENMSNTTFLQALDSADGKDQFDDVIAKLELDGTPYKFISDIVDESPVMTRGPSDPTVAAARAKITYSGFYKYQQARGVIAVGQHTNTNGVEQDNPDTLYIKWDTSAKRYQFGSSIVSGDEISPVIWGIIDGIIKDTGRPLVIATQKVYDKIPEDWEDISELIPAKLAVVMSKQSFVESQHKWACTGLNLEQAKYDAAVNDPQVNPMFKEYFDAIRGITFGTSYDYLTIQFIKNVYGDSKAANPFGFVSKFANHVFNLQMLKTLANRHYSNWPETEFKESLIVFSSMVKCGIIDEQKLKSILMKK
jgi:hypothetical protein